MNRSERRTQLKVPKGQDNIPANGSIGILSSGEQHHLMGQNESNGHLDSWKQIALYLGREVRTAQRWEKTERLPVHRHVHQKNGSVYAFKNELDAWRESRSTTNASAVTPEPSLIQPSEAKRDRQAPNDSSLPVPTAPWATWQWVDTGAQTVLLYLSDSQFIPAALHLTYPLKHFSTEYAAGITYPAARRERPERRRQMARQA
jgi:hypothetical protein